MQVRVLKDMLEVSDIPVVKSIMEKFISYGFKTLLVFPGKQQVDFTPAPLPGPEWEGLRVCGLSQGVLTVRIECENMDNAKKSGKQLSMRELIIFVYKYMSNCQIWHELYLEK